MHNHHGIKLLTRLQVGLSHLRGHKSTDTHQFLEPTFPILITVKKEYPTVKL